MECQNKPAAELGSAGSQSGILSKLAENVLYTSYPPLNLIFDWIGLRFGFDGTCCHLRFRWLTWFAENSIGQAPKRSRQPEAGRVKRVFADLNHSGLAVARASHLGRVRAVNEDRVLLIEEKGLFVLADGMGGHKGGAVASSVAVDTIAAAVVSGAKLVEAIEQANRAVIQAGRQTGAPELGTTVVAVQVTGYHFHLAWVGDSRAYRFSEEPERLTADHSVVRGMVTSGEIAEAQARDHPLRNMLTRALGSTGLELSQVGTASGQLRPGDYLLLCSDGLHGVLDDEQMHGLIRGARCVQAAVDALLKAALDRGGPDNISMILLGPPETGE